MGTSAIPRQEQSPRPGAACSEFLEKILDVRNGTSASRRLHRMMSGGHRRVRSVLTGTSNMQAVVGAACCGLVPDHATSESQ
jgi:hypothetical protein